MKKRLKAKKVQLKMQLKKMLQLRKKPKRKKSMKKKRKKKLSTSTRELSLITVRPSASNTKAVRYSS